jgi:hypothetical protein
MKTTTGFSASFWFRYTSLYNNYTTNLFGTDNYTENGVLRLISACITYNTITAIHSITIWCGAKYNGTSYSSCTMSNINGSTYGISNNGAWNHIGYSISTTGVVILVINGTQVAWTGGNVVYLQSQGPGANVHLADNIKSYSFCVGSTPYLKVCGVAGNVDQLRLYNATLTVAQIQDLYNNRC